MEAQAVEDQPAFARADAVKKLQQAREARQALVPLVLGALARRYAELLERAQKDCSERLLRPRDLLPALAQSSLAQEGLSRD